MKYLVLDVETTGATNDTFGNPFTADNRLVYFGGWSGSYWDFPIIYGNVPYGHSINQINRGIHGAELLVGFNIKFDLHWLRRYSCLDWSNLPDIWDCQLAHFILTGQTAPYPSLSDVCEYYGIEGKLDVVKTEYWNKGIDTDQIPEDVLREYLKQDVMVTQQIFELQKQELQKNPQLKRLIWYNCQDLKITAEMEWNGIKYDIKKSMEKGDFLEKRISEIDRSLSGLFPALDINWNSDNHLSAILYGGSLSFPVKESYVFTYKDGRTAEKVRNAAKLIEFTRLVNPIKGTELKKEGFWSVSEKVLRKLKVSGTAKLIVDGVLERATLETKRNRYYHGFPILYEKMGWEDEILHTNLNHVVAATGRLSSTKPNIQNMEEEMRECVVTRF